MSPIIVKYPLDLTGRSTNNLVVSEQHALNSDYKRAFTTKYGPFYTAGLIVRQLPSRQVLVPNVDYIATHLYQEPTIASGKEVCGIIVILDPLVSNLIEIDYQVVGGEWSQSVEAIEQLIETLDLDERPVQWGDIIDKPSAFPPTAHLHAVGDVYGFEYVVDALENIRQALLQGDIAAHQEIYDYIGREISGFAASVATVATDLAAHVANKSNPHQTTKSHVGLGSVLNYGVATQLESEGGLIDTKYMTPLRTAQAVAKQALLPLNTHVSNTANPHQTTKAQVGLGSVENYAVSDQTNAENGVVNNQYMTPLRTAQAITVKAVVPLNAFIALRNNPHQVTKAQVGLSNVDNLATADQVSAENGAVNTLFMTPLRTAQAIAKQAVLPLNNHIGNTSNPHQVTKTQVGLGNIPNAISPSRSLNSAATLLTSAGMFDHVQAESTDHDNRYKPYGQAMEGSMVSYGGYGHMYIAGAWRVIWPPQWQ